MRQSLAAKFQPKEWELPLNIDRPGEPHYMPTQAAFLYDFQNRFTAYGGGLGNGKTTAGVVRAWLLSIMFAGNTGFIARFDGKELRQTTIAEFRRLIPESFIEKKNDQLGYFKFKPQYGGSEIFFGDLKADILNNINLGWFWCDQSEEIDEARWNMLVSRLRKKTPILDENGQQLCDPDGYPLIAKTYGFATFNPEGRNSYLWRFFHPDSPEKKPDYQLYQASTYDGLAAGFTTQDYVDGMLAVFSEDAKRRYLDGSWDVFSGRIYPQFSESTHVLPYAVIHKYLATTPHTLYESIDHGLTNPTAVQWWAVDCYGNRFLIDEHYEGGGKPVSYHAGVILAKRSQLKQPIALTYIDSACFAKSMSSQDRVFSVVDEYHDSKIFPIAGQKDWATGYNRITQGLNLDAGHAHPITGELGAPFIFISAHCQYFIKEAISYRWKKNRITTALRNAPDKPQDLDDHHMNAWQYFESSRPAQPVIQQKHDMDPLKVIAEQRSKYNPLAEPAHAGSWMSL